MVRSERTRSGWPWPVRLVLALVGSASLIRGLNPFGQQTIDRSPPPVLKSIQNLSQYHAAVGNFQVVIDVENDIKNVPAALAGQRTLFVAAGTVNAFIDFSHLSGDALKVEAKTVRIR